jgi:[ribosomal protein S5]-alanine N-acetyltransferase
MFKNNQSVYLRALEIDDYKLINKWRNDPEISNMLVGNKIFVSSVREKAWVEEKIHNDRLEMYFALCNKETNEMVGYSSIRQINWRNKSACWGGLTLGKEHWKKGYAMAANALILEFAFDELGINKFYTDYLEEHEVSAGIFKKMGFKEEGIARQDVFKNNKFHNVVKVSLLKREYDEMKQAYKANQNKTS